MAPPRLGLRANWRQVALLVAVTGLVGSMVGLERNLVPLLASGQFHVVGLEMGSFVAAFAFTKAPCNLLASWASERWGRKRVLVAGWVVGLAVPLLILAAPDWGWVVAANVLLGVNQALTWSMAVNMKIDLVGAARRGLAMGFNESAGYLAVGLTALVAGGLADSLGLRPWPFVLGLGLAVAGLLISLFLVRDTSLHVAAEVASASRHGGEAEEPRPSIWRVVRWTSWSDRPMSTACQAGLVNNLNDGMVWATLPIYLVTRGASFQEMVSVTAAYPIVWGALQVGTGALSDRWGRRPLVVAGMALQGAALTLLALTDGFYPWMLAAMLLGGGTAMVYPVLIAVVGDVALPAWRATAVGVYRFWRDAGYGVGALLATGLAATVGYTAAIETVAAITFFSAALAASRLDETLPARRSGVPVS